MAQVALVPRLVDAPVPIKRTAAKHAVTRQLEILVLRSFDLADRVVAGGLSFQDAVDLAYWICHVSSTACSGSMQ